MVSNNLLCVRIVVVVLKGRVVRKLVGKKSNLPITAAVVSARS